jgi:2-alkenal reductase
MRKSAILIVALLVFVLAGCNLLPDGRPASSAPTSLPVSQAVATPAPPAGGSGVSAATATNVPVPLSGTGRQSDVVRVVQSVGPAVVTVVNQLGSNDPSGAGGEALGSGVIIDTAGHIITNDHVVEGQQSITVIYADGKKVNNVQVVGTDTLSDLAVLKVDGSVPATATLGDSNAIMPGETVVAIGSALGDFRNTVTVGVISGVHRNLVGTDTSMEDMIQTDAAINHGNSGGPLINLDGQVIGINTAILRTTDPSNPDVAEGLGFAIPSNTVKSISAQLISKGKVSRPYLGVTTLAVTPSIAAYYSLQDAQGNQLDSGAFVREVRAGTPADRAGVQVGDVITGINNFKIDTDHGLGTVLTNFNPYDTVTLHLLRDGNSLDLTTTLAEH